MKTYDFKTSGYFPWHIMAVGVGMVITAIAMLINAMFIGGPIVLLIAFTILTTHYRCSIDFAKKEYHDYLWVLGMKNGEKNNFEDVKYLFVKPGQVRQTMGLRAANTTIQKTIYDGYLKFSETDKIHIDTKDNKESLIAKLRPIATKLGVEILDYSDDGIRKTWGT